jgi:hypothetical protein
MSKPGEFHVDAMLCDSVVNAENKLYMQGAGWNMLLAGGFPFVAPRIGVALIVSVPWTETNKSHEMALSLHDDEQQLSLGPVDQGSGPAAVPKPGVLRAPFNVGRPPMLTAGDAQLLPLAINLDGYQFQRAGGYSFRVEIDNREIANLDFRVLSSGPGTLMA